MALFMQIVVQAHQMLIVLIENHIEHYNLNCTYTVTSTAYLKLIFMKYDD